MPDLPTAPIERRYDRGELLRSLRRADGTLLLEGYAARAGVLEYRRDGRVVRELVPQSVIDASAAAMARAPLTLHHPDPRRHPNGVTPQNVQSLLVGDSGTDVVVEEGGYVRLQFAVRRADAIEAVETGKARELSAGYGVRMDWTPGVDPEHGPYDGVQVERIPNHVALVPAGRAGRRAAVRYDGAETVERIGRTRGHRPQGGSVNPGLIAAFALLGITQRVDDDDDALSLVGSRLRQRLDAEAAEKAELSRKLDAERARADAAVAQVTVITAERDALKSENTKRLDGEARKVLEPTAKRLGVDPTAHPEVKSLRRAIAQAHLGAAYRADSSDEYVTAISDYVTAAGPTARADADPEPNPWKGAPAPEPRNDGERPPAAAPVRNVMVDRWSGKPMKGDR